MSAPNGPTTGSPAKGTMIGSKSRPTFARTLGFFGFFAITASMVMTVYE
ncbi:MAG: hypothetical protein RR672_04440 [Raoultibacter sp.]